MNNIGYKLKNMKLKNNNPLLITGASGFLGGHLLKVATDFGLDTIGTKSGSSLGRNDGLVELDITCKDNVFKTIKKIRPSVIIHCAAISDMAICEMNGELAYSVNELGTKNLCEAAVAMGMHLVYISTDLVFDGIKGDYVESDTPCPTSAYGKSKLAGEVAVLNASKNFTVARLSWCYGRSINKAKNYLDKFIEAISDGKEQNLFYDEFRSPIKVEDACNKLLELVNNRSNGIFHLAGDKKMSRLDFGLWAADEFELDKSLIKRASRKKLAPHRPRDTSLASTR